MDLIEQYNETVPTWIGEKGVWPTPAIVRLDNDKLEFIAFDVEAQRIIYATFRNCWRPDVVEQIIALDTYTKPDQGTTLDSCLILFHLVRGQPARIGVLEYSWNGGEPVTKPVVWDNAFWCKAYEKLAADLTKAFG